MSKKQRLKYADRLNNALLYLLATRVVGLKQIIAPIADSEGFYQAFQDKRVFGNELFCSGPCFENGHISPVVERANANDLSHRNIFVYNSFVPGINTHNGFH